MIILLDTNIWNELHDISDGWYTSAHVITAHVTRGICALLIMLHVEPVLFSAGSFTVGAPRSSGGSFQHTLVEH